jgi:hypothetical protein
MTNHQVGGLFARGKAIVDGADSRCRARLGEGVRRRVAPVQRLTAGSAGRLKSDCLFFDQPIDIRHITLWWYWMFVITVPIGVVLLAIAYFRARRNGWPRGTGTA